MTPSGNVYGTTPGGTRIKYGRQDLLQMRGSPLSKGKLADMAVIPGITLTGLEDKVIIEEETILESDGLELSPELGPLPTPDDCMFPMDS